MKKSHFTARAFTLVELIVVIAIIAILTGIILTSLTGSKAKGRDAQRVSDLGQIQLALELYFDRCHQYPPPDGHLIDNTNTLGKSDGCPSGSNVTFGSYIGKIPAPPIVTTQSAYDYYTNSATVPTDYVLHAILEGQSTASANSLTPVPSDILNGSSLTCDTNTNYCVGPK